jgi:lipopolysaccharide/colanic/teichoic acid biosynthesis glycosyltransferase
VPDEPRDGAEGGAGAVLSGRDEAGGVVRTGLPRAFDALLAAVGLVVASPVLLLTGAAVVLTSGLPVLFRQARVGRGGRPFTLVKLRTMRTSGSGAMVTARGDQRVTSVGRLLRRSKLDELPELWNILRGDMAFVGPRPEVPELVDPENPRWKEVLSVRPGLTDPVTVRLRDEETLMASVAGDHERYYRETLQPEKLRGYVEYLHNRSWHSDLRVIGETLIALFRPSGLGTRKGSSGPNSGSANP